MLRYSHNFSDTQPGLLLVLLLLPGGLFRFYNAYRMGKLRWKPSVPANPRLMTLVVFLIIVPAAALLAAVK